MFSQILSMLSWYILYFHLSTDFSLSVWKQENGVNNTNLTTAQIVVLQEDLGVSKYFLDAACSRHTTFYSPHINYWKNGIYLLYIYLIMYCSTYNRFNFEIRFSSNEFLWMLKIIVRCLFVYQGTDMLIEEICELQTFVERFWYFSYMLFAYCQ